MTKHTPEIRPYADFVNEPFLDLTDPNVKRAMETALAGVQAVLGCEYDMIIGGARIRTTERILSRNPAYPARVVGIHQAAGEEHVEPAMHAAQTAFASWSQVPATQRAALLLRVAGLVRQH